MKLPSAFPSSIYHPLHKQQSHSSREEQTSRSQMNTGMQTRTHTHWIEPAKFWTWVITVWRFVLTAPTRKLDYAYSVLLWSPHKEILQVWQTWFPCVTTLSMSVQLWAISIVIQSLLTNCKCFLREKLPASSWSSSQETWRTIFPRITHPCIAFLPQATKAGANTTPIINREKPRRLTL